MPLFFMKEKRFQHVISYSNNEFCIEGTWLTDCTNPCKSLYSPNEDIIQSPPIFFHSNTFYLSFYFDTHHELFKIFIDIENDITNSFPISVNLIMKNHNPKNTLHFQNQIYFTPQTKHCVATFNKKTSREIFSDEGFYFDGFFVFQYSFKHKKSSIQSPLKYNFYSQNMNFVSHASKYLLKNDSFLPIKNNCKYAGICNQGATCYLNSILQALFHIPAFRSILYQIPITDSDKSNKTMIYNLQKLFAQMETSNEAASTRNLTISFGWTSAESFKQNDAQELLRVFLESLEKKLKNKIKDQKSTDTLPSNKPIENLNTNNNKDNNNNNNNDNDNYNNNDNNNDNNNNNNNDNDNNNNNNNINDNNNDNSNNNNNNNNNDNANNDNQTDDSNTNNNNSQNSDISDLFKFQVIQSIECPKVSFRNTRADDYLDLAVEVRGCKNLYQSLKKFTMAEKLDSPYSTDEFGPQEAIMYNKFKNLPKVLFIHLKRFEFRPPGLTERFVNKISSNFQLTNNLTKINDKFEFPKIIDFSEFIEQTNNEDWTYELFGVLVHSGSASFGHYYAYLRPENTNQWFKFNDSIVNECSESEAINQNYGDGSNCASGYMLIYMRRKDLPQLFTEKVKPPKELLIKEEIEPKKEKKVEPISKKIETKTKPTQNLSEESNIFYNFNVFGTNLLQVKIITDENLRDGCDECSLAISNTNKDGYFKGKQAPYLFHDSGIILIHRSATERELFDRISSFFNTKEQQKGEEKIEKSNENIDDSYYYLDQNINNLIFNSNKEKDSQPNHSDKSIDNLIYKSDKPNNEPVLNINMNINKFDLYMMNASDGTISRKLESTDDQVSYFGQNNIYVFYRSHEQKEKSNKLNINNYNIDEKNEEEDEEDKNDQNSNNDNTDDDYFKILEIDDRFDRVIKHTLNAGLFLTNSVYGIFNGATNIVTKGIDVIKANNNQIINKIRKKNKNKNKGEKILIFLKIFDYNKQEIRFLKTKNVYHDDPLSVLFNDALDFYFPEEKNISNQESVKFYCKKFSTIFDVADPTKTFKENKIYNGCLIIMQNINKEVKIPHKKEETNNKNNLEIKIEYPSPTNSLLDYIDAKYNMCDAIVSSYDHPSDYLFILRFSFNNDVSTLKSIVAKAAGIDSYDPQKNSIILYTQHLNSEDEPSNTPLSNVSRLTSPLNRIFFRFFDETPEAKINQMVPVKVWIDDLELKTILAPRSGTVKDVVQKINGQTEPLNSEPFDVSLEKSGAVLCNIPYSFKIFNITTNTCIHMSIKKIEDDKKEKMAVCHTKGIKLFVPFFFDVLADEKFSETKVRLKEEIKKHSNQNDAGLNNFDDDFFNSLSISIHRLNKSMYDTMKPTLIADDDKLFDVIKNDKTSFLFIELPKSGNNEKSQTTKATKKNNNVIIID